MVKLYQLLMFKINHLALMEKEEERRKASYKGEEGDLEYWQKGEGLLRLDGLVLDLMWTLEAERS